MSFQNCRVAGKNVDSRLYHESKEETKRGDPAFVMSPSAMVAFARLPSRWVRGWNPPDSKAKEWGNLLDCRTLTPELFEARYAVEPEKYSVTRMECPECGSITDSRKCGTCKVDRVPIEVEKPWRYGSDFCDGWKSKQEAAKKEIVSPKMLADCDAAVARLFEPVDGDDTIRRWFDASDRQVLVVGEWKDEETGLVVPVSCLLDFVPRIDSEFPSSLGDLKSTKAAHPLKFSRQLFDFGYHIQSAFDTDMYVAATGEDRNTWCFIIQENFEPWEPNRAIFGQEGDMGMPGFLELGRDPKIGYPGILANYCRCVKSGRWPGYNQMDETVQGWCVLRPEPFQTNRALFAPQYDFEEPETPMAEEENFDVPIP